MRAIWTMVGAAALMACTDATGVGEGRFSDLALGADESALVGRVVDAAGQPMAGVRVAACSDVDCPFATADEEGYFVHSGLEPDRPRRFEVFGQYDQYGSVVFRREFTPGGVEDVGDVVIPATSGERATWPPEEGGAVALADGALTLAADPETVIWPLGTVDFDIQVAAVPAEAIPPYYNQPWVGREAGALGFSTVPFDLHASAPVTARVEGLGAPEGTRYDVFHSDPLDGFLEKAGTATVDADGALVTDEGCDLHDLTFFLFVPHG